MANEIKLNVQLFCANGTYTPPAWTESGSYTQNAIDASGGVINCTTSFAALPLGSVSTLGYCMMKNLDATNNVDVGIDSSGFVAVMTLKPTEVAAFRFKAGVTPAVKAATGTAKLQFWLLQD